jgi:hypothetical protein
MANSKGKTATHKNRGEKKNRRARERTRALLAGNVKQVQEITMCATNDAQPHMVDRHYSLNLKQWSARTLYVYAHADLAQKYSVALQ